MNASPTGSTISEPQMPGRRGQDVDDADEGGSAWLCNTRDVTNFGGEQHWRANARQWIRWARKPGHDAYWAYRDQFRDFLPPPGPSTLEIGCGEGRISRDLTAAGHNVTAIDISPELIDAAKEARSARHYHVADAAALPFSNNNFDCVVAYNVLMNVPDLTAVVKESARVLAMDGHLVISIVHPFIDRMIFPDKASNLFEFSDSYFAISRFDEAATEAGLTMHFAGWSRPLQDYAQALTDAGLAIVKLLEPHHPRHDRWSHLPLFLWIDACVTTA
jgi:ubiquinone/menaquinone biosynthesis C-methylase UbiE